MKAFLRRLFSGHAPSPLRVALVGLVVAVIVVLALLGLLN